ncbi:hypothetical protein IM538_13700 [Cytobacillus suaedae]|nr:hypothetical protein IM538_13700 [Cytobacillus suaedae]
MNLWLWFLGIISVFVILAIISDANSKHKRNINHNSLNDKVDPIKSQAQKQTNNDHMGGNM